MADLPKNIEDLKAYVADNFEKLSDRLQLELIKTLHKFLNEEELAKKELELEQKNLDEQKALSTCAIDDETSKIQEKILEEIRKNAHIDVHSNKDLSSDPRDEDAKYVDATMDKAIKDPNDPLGDYLDELEDLDKTSS